MIGDLNPGRQRGLPPGVTYPLPRNWLSGGVVANNVSDAVNDVDVGAGEAKDSTNQVNMRWQSTTKQLDVSFALGSNQGGRSAAALANGTWHVFAISRGADDLSEIFFDTSVTPALPSSYRYFRRIASLPREAASIIGFVQFGDEFWRKTPTTDVNQTNAGTAAVTRTASVPTGVKVKWFGSVRFAIGGTGAQVYISSLDLPDNAAGAPNFTLGSEGLTGNIETTNCSVWTNTSAQFRTRQSASDASMNLQMYTMGWVDLRDRWN
jgi:hypothetical protein